MNEMAADIPPIAYVIIIISENKNRHILMTVSKYICKTRDRSWINYKYNSYLRSSTLDDL